MPQITVYIKGNFSGSNAGPVDVFAGGPNGHVFKTIQMSWDYSVTATSTVLTLPSTGSYMVGMGPAMPKGPMPMGPPPTMNWMPPKPVDVSVSGSAGAWSWIDPNTGTTDNGVNNGKVEFAVTTANRSIIGHVYGKSGTSDPVKDAEVFAYSPQKGFGNHARTLADGSFSVAVSDGLYFVGTFMPGMPPGQERSVEIITSGGTTSYYVDGVLQSGTLDVVLSIDKPAYTISGTVSDASDNALSGAGVYAYRTDGPGHAESMTDSKGKYILYVGSGTWTVGAYAPGYGELDEKTGLVIPNPQVTSGNQSGIDFAPESKSSAGNTVTWRTIEGVVFKDDNNTNANVWEAADTEYPDSFVRAVNDRTGKVIETETMASGTFKLTVPEEANLTDTYTIYAHIPGVGDATPTSTISVDSGNVAFSSTGPNLKVEPTATTTIRILDADGNPYTASKASVDLYDTTVKFDTLGTIKNATTTDIQLPCQAAATS
ncbi:MAG: carboxypeptidase-like regulatory domain-containing protein, partial [Planctomycetota bacterium]